MRINPLLSWAERNVISLTLPHLFICNFFICLRDRRFKLIPSNTWSRDLILCMSILTRTYWLTARLRRVPAMCFWASGLELSQTTWHRSGTRFSCIKGACNKEICEQSKSKINVFTSTKTVLLIWYDRKIVHDHQYLIKKSLKTHVNVKKKNPQ